jgi:hypothetical protein
MKLQQGQVWKTEAEFIRVVKLERLAVDFKVFDGVSPQDGSHQRMTKKQFCRLINGARLLLTEEVKLMWKEEGAGSEDKAGK